MFGGVRSIRSPQWRYELANGAGIRCAIDDQARTVHLTLASPRHPDAIT
jgi:hypothetical protein